MRKAPLRAVRVSDDPEPKKKQTVDQAAASGDHLALLVAMRERIAIAVADPDCPPRDLAALTRRLQDISKEIEGINMGKEQDSTAPTEDEAWDSEAI